MRWEREQYARVAPDPTHWPTLFAKVIQENTDWQGLSPTMLGQLPMPVLIACGDHDLVPIDACAAVARRIPHGQFAVFPDASHFLLFSDPRRFFATVTAFLDAPPTTVPLATFVTGYQPGVTR